MPGTTELPYFIIHSTKLAEWIDGQAGLWWNVDGDSVLTSVVDFPCPHDELSAALRHINKSIRLFDPREGADPHGEEVEVKELEEIADRQNNSKARTYLLSWEGDELQWLLSEELHPYDEAVEGD